MISSVLSPRRPWHATLATVLAAAALPLLAAPYDLHALHWIVYLPMFWALDPVDVRRNRRLAWLYGTVGVGLLFWWIVHTIVVFSPIPWFGAVPILGLFAAVFGAPYIALWPAVHPLRRVIGPWWVVVFPALEVVIEWVSMKVLLFPYQHGVSQYRFPYTWQLASVTGVWGLSYLVFLVNAALAEVLYRARESRPFPVGPVVGAAAAWVATVAFGAWRYSSVTERVEAAPVLKVAQLQSDKGMEYRMSHSPREAWNEWLAATQQIPPGAVDLVVWPEGASPYDLNETPGRRNLARELLSEEARRGGHQLVIGGGTRIREADAEMGEARTRVFNSVYVFDRDGTELGHYDKMVPLPFGEYLPLAKYLPRGLASGLNIGDFEAGTEPRVFDVGAAHLATPICYEAILPDTCRRFEGATLLVNGTNDAWFGDTASPHQHAMLAASRSIELGVPMIRSAYTGVSMVVEANGDIHDETEPFTAVSRPVQVHLASFETPYRRFGNWFVGVCLLVVVVGAARLTRPLDSQISMR
ncbi:MAG: apolipoprotein N-acyltransferase [Myxococcota bacterium]